MSQTKYFLGVGKIAILWQAQKIRQYIRHVVKEGHLTVRFGEYLFGRPKSPEIFGFSGFGEISFAKHHLSSSKQGD